MFKKNNELGFTLIEVLVAIAVFCLFALGIYSGITAVFKIVFESRMQILETAILSEQLEIVRNLPYDSVGTLNGVPTGVLVASKTVKRDGINFSLITTVRNIDDPYDGVAGGSPADLSSADYKIVEMSAICQNCNQRNPVILNTIIAPKGLEGSSKNGHLFINVFDASGHGVAQASVQVTNSSTTPNIAIDEVTDNDGWLRIVDTPTGTLSYKITVTKNGYSSDYTITPSAQITNPTKLPANVASQQVTEIYFSIDKLAQMDLYTIGPTCAAIGSIPFNIHGEKTIGSNPVVYKYNKNFNTGSNGIYGWPTTEWDKYYFSVASSSYMIAGSIPLLPVVLNPDSYQPVYLILQPKTTNSLLVQVKDAGTGLPLSDAVVHLESSYYNSTSTTGLGYARQTDWSGGSGQVSFSNSTKYYSDNSSINVSNPTGDVKLKMVGSNYLTSGILESSTFDLGTTVDFRNIIITPTTQDAQTGSVPVRFQLATSNSSTPSSWVYYGPNGTTSTYYTPTSTVIWSGADGYRYFRYKAYLSTSYVKRTPDLQEVAFTYTTACTPPGQVFFSGLSAGTYTLEVYRDGYLTTSDSIDVSGNLNTVVNLSASS